MDAPMNTVFMEKIRNDLDSERNTVLLVDDERGIRKKVARDIMAFDPNIVVYEACNGQEALDELTKIRTKYSCDPAMIVLDLNMPIMDGWEFIERLKAQYEGMGQTEGIPIIVLSSTSGEKQTGKKDITVHDRTKGYVPMITVAKEVCADKKLYNEEDEGGLITWLEYLLSM
jgi:CheY-like chemotaxis protein